MNTNFMPFYTIFKNNKKDKKNHKENSILEFEKNYKENNILEFKKNYKENEEIQNAQDMIEFKIITYFNVEDIKKIINNSNSKNFKIDFTDFIVNKFKNSSEINNNNDLDIIELIIKSNNIVDLNKAFNNRWFHSKKTTLFLMIMLSMNYNISTHLNISKKIKELNFNEDLGDGVTYLVYLIAYNRFEATKFLIQEGAKNFQIKKEIKISIPQIYAGRLNWFNLNENDTIIEVLKRSKFTNDQKLELSDLLREKKLV